MKQLAKSLVNLIATITVLPLFLLMVLSELVGAKGSMFVACTQFLSLFPGKLGNFMRKNFLRRTSEYCSAHCLIGFGTLFSHLDTEIHDNVYIGPQCNIGKSIIRKNCLLGSGVHILSGKSQHNFECLDTPIQEQGGTFNKISIGEDTWIGNGAIIMANVGKKCVIGAGSVVTKDLPDYSVATGNPATVVKSRKYHDQ